jgi:hypothetical protein
MRALFNMIFSEGILIKIMPYGFNNKKLNKSVTVYSSLSSAQFARHLVKDNFENIG